MQFLTQDGAYSKHINNHTNYTPHQLVHNAPDVYWIYVLSWHLPDVTILRGNVNLDGLNHLIPHIPPHHQHTTFLCRRLIYCQCLHIWLYFLFQSNSVQSLQPCPIWHVYDVGAILPLGLQHWMHVRISLHSRCHPNMLNITDQINSSPT